MTTCREVKLARPEWVGRLPGKEEKDAARAVGLVIETEKCGGSPVIWRFYASPKKRGDWGVGNWVPATLGWWTPKRRGKQPEFEAVLGFMKDALAEMRCRRLVGAAGWWWRG